MPSVGDEMLLIENFKDFSSLFLIFAKKTIFFCQIRPIKFYMQEAKLQLNLSKRLNYRKLSIDSSVEKMQLVVLDETGCEFLEKIWKITLGPPGFLKKQKIENFDNQYPGN